MFAPCVAGCLLVRLLLSMELRASSHPTTPTFWKNGGYVITFLVLQRNEFDAFFCKKGEWVLVNRFSLSYSAVMHNLWKYDTRRKRGRKKERGEGKKKGTEEKGKEKKKKEIDEGKKKGEEGEEK